MSAHYEQQTRIQVLSAYSSSMWSVYSARFTHDYAHVYVHTLSWHQSQRDVQHSLMCPNRQNNLILTIISMSASVWFCVPPQCKNKA